MDGMDGMDGGACGTGCDAIWCGASLMMVWCFAHTSRWVWMLTRSFRSQSLLNMVNSRARVQFFPTMAFLSSSSRCGCPPVVPTNPQVVCAYRDVMDYSLTSETYTSVFDEPVVLELGDGNGRGWCVDVTFSVLGNDFMPGPSQDRWLWIRATLSFPDSALTRVCERYATMLLNNANMTATLVADVPPGVTSIAFEARQQNTDVVSVDATASVVATAK